jgi:cytochrome P450
LLRLLVGTLRFADPTSLLAPFYPRNYAPAPSTLARSQQDHPMASAGLAPLDETITIAELTRDPYPIYRRLRREAPVLRVKSVGRTFLTRAADCKYVKDQAALFSADDPNTPMQRAFLAHTLMRKDHGEHRAERMAMMPALMPKTIEQAWAPLYTKLAADYLERLPRGEVVDLFPALAGPLAARILAHATGLADASDADMQRWSQTLIDGAGNFGWTPGPFEASDAANAEMDKCIRANIERVRAEPDSSTLSFMVNAKHPIAESQIIANVKITIGGGINEPRDALLTVLYGLLTHPDQLEAVRAAGKWRSAFEEGVRWVAPIQASSRLVMEDTEIRGCLIPKGDTVMTIQASANRDEDTFEDGENFHALRDPNPHQAFGNGAHHCAGAHLSRRTVGVILLPMLFERFPNMTLPEPASVRWHGFGFRGPLNLPVRLQ